MHAPPFTSDSVTSHDHSVIRIPETRQELHRRVNAHVGICVYSAWKVRSRYNAVYDIYMVPCHTFVFV